MTGFIRGLFRSKPTAETENTQQPPAQTRNGRKAEAYYLSPDDAKTYGDIEFMRSEKSIRRTFPKAKMGTDNESIRKISSLASIADENRFISPDSQPAQPQATAPASTPEIDDRRRTDTNMDMFRNMAREMRKR